MTRKVDREYSVPILPRMDLVLPYGMVRRDGMEQDEDWATV